MFDRRSLNAWRGRAGSALRALRHRNYRLFFFGQGVSLIGTWMQGLALGWLVFDLTGSELWLGVVAFSSQIMTFALAPFAGVIADHVNRRKLLVATQTLAMCQAFALAALTFTGVITVTHIVVLGCFMGMLNGFDIPVRQSFVLEMLESREDLPNAIALNSSLVNGAKLVGPSLAGVLIAWTGEGVCFLLNGISFLAVIVALLAMRLPTRKQRTERVRMLHRLREGFVYATQSPPIRSVLLLVAVFSLAGMSYGVLMPAYVKDVLHGGPQTLGFLMAASGLGALCGAMFLATRSGVRGLVRVIAAASMIFGVCLMAFSQSRMLPLSLVLIGAGGFGTMIQLAGSNTFLQTVVHDDKRGRVMSFYTMAFMGMGPFGGLLAGALASWLGVPTALFIGGAGCVCAASVFALRLRWIEPYILPAGPVQVLAVDGAEEAVRPEK